VEALALLWLLRGRLGEAATQLGARLGGTFVRSVAAAALMAGAVQGWLWWWGEQTAAAGVLGAWIAAGVGMVIAVVVYAGASVLLRGEEVRLARAMLLRRGR
jgi:peptidoglycan biosynthesis protein MviN/MurJ (putative lipid II flippase)